MPVTMDPKAKYHGGGQWKRSPTTGPLTDRKIDRYVKQGYYSLEARQARKEYRERKQATKRHGNWVQFEGRMIYSP